jgi:hypothetical protein
VVEFALALPILLLMLFGIIDFSLLFSGWLLVQNVSRQAVRYAVTGGFDPGLCPDGAGCTTGTEAEIQEDQEIARLDSIRAEAERFYVGMLVDESAAESDPGYVLVTVCSSRDDGGVPRISDPGVMGSQTDYSECRPSEDAGGPDDTVVVMVDFNHPYITPLLNEVWPMVHLYSAHRGTVEAFRISSVIELPPAPEQPTLTPSLTWTPSHTYTPSDTPSPTSTATPTESPTPSFTLTPTRTPDCSLYTLDNWVQFFWSGGTKPTLTIHLINSSPDDVQVTRMDFLWDAYDHSNPGQTLDQIRFNWTIVAGSDDGSSPTTRLFSPGRTSTAGSWSTIAFDFKYADAAWPGIVPASSFGLAMLLDNGCIVTILPVATPTASNTPTISLTPTRSLSPTISDTPTRTVSATPSFTPSQSGTRTNTRTASSTRTASRTHTPTNTSRPSNTSTSTRTPSRSWTRSITNTPTITLTPTRTFTRSNTPTRSISATITRTPSRSLSPTITLTGTKTYTPTQSRSRTASSTPSSTRTGTNTRTATRTFTRTTSPTRSYTPTQSYTRSNTGTITNTPTRTFTPLPTTPTFTKTLSPTKSPTKSLSPTPSETICFDC